MREGEGGGRREGRGGREGKRWGSIKQPHSQATATQHTVVECTIQAHRSNISIGP